MPVTSPSPASGWRPGCDALERIVSRHDRRLRRAARAYGLAPSDVDDVVQSTWVQYLEHGHALRDSAATGAWLETTARRLSLRLLQRGVRERPVAPEDVPAGAGGLEPEAAALAAERRATVHGALARLPERQRRLMRLLVLRPDLSYEEAGRRLSMPIGSIGPTRARCLERLRLDPRLRALEAA